MLKKSDMKIKSYLQWRFRVRKDKPRTGDETPRGRFCTRHARVIDGVVVAAEMVAIFFSVTMNDHRVLKLKWSMTGSKWISLVPNLTLKLISSIPRQCCAPQNMDRFVAPC